MRRWVRQKGRERVRLRTKESERDRAGELICVDTALEVRSFYLLLLFLSKPQKLPIPQLRPDGQIINTPKLSSFDYEYFEMRLEGKI